MDAGVIESVKVRYSTVQMELAVDLIDNNAKDIYKIDIFSAMRALTRVWEELF